VEERSADSRRLALRRTRVREGLMGETSVRWEHGGGQTGGSRCRAAARAGVAARAHSHAGSPQRIPVHRLAGEAARKYHGAHANVHQSLQQQQARAAARAEGRRVARVTGAHWQRTGALTPAWRCTCASLVSQTDPPGLAALMIPAVPPPHLAERLSLGVAPGEGVEIHCQDANAGVQHDPAPERTHKPAADATCVSCRRKGAHGAVQVAGCSCKPRR